MKSTTDTTAAMADTFNGNWELQTFLTTGLTPGFKLGPTFSREFPAFLRRASRESHLENISSNRKNRLAHPIGKSMETN
ncbi:MAG: hypothetical protein LBB26_04180 [Puniceicoccales bacterium]|jgi:hypothetical protein|nr:hypothetical protein [Puniceicoccales bacterium]